MTNTPTTPNTNALHVIFGTGQIGLGIMHVLCEQGQRVRMVNRSGQRKGLREGVELVNGDASDPAFAVRAAEGATHIYQTLNPPYHQWLVFFPGLQAGVVAAAEATGAKLIVMENLYAYGHTHGQPMTESTPFNPNTRKGRLRAQMTRDLMDAYEQGRIRVTMGRASDFIGPRGTDSALGEIVVEPALTGKAARLTGNPEMPHTYSYTDDIARALVILGAEDRALGEAWHIPSPPTLTTRQVIEKLYAETGHPPKIAVAPKPIMGLLGLFSPMIREVNEMVYEFEAPFLMDHSKFAAAFGDIATPWEQVIPATVAWFRQHTAQAQPPGR